jgi:YesN/AraC family two-component response regulator
MTTRAKRTVLIVDDDGDLRHVLRLVCEVESYEVVGEASNGLEAIALAMSKRPDIVILDQLMPYVDGEGTAQILRTLCPESRIVAFSAILDREPVWSDSYLNKARLTEIAPLLHALI